MTLQCKYHITSCMPRHEYFSSTTNIINSVFLGMKAKLILSQLSVASSYYPNFENWLDKVLLGIKNRLRTIIFAQINDHLAGLIILKHTNKKNKICTLWVTPEFRRKHIGSDLINLSMLYFTSMTANITVPDFAMSTVNPFLNEFKFIHQGFKDGLYREGIKEHFFNSNPRQYFDIKFYSPLESIQNNFVELYFSLKNLTIYDEWV